MFLTSFLLVNLVFALILYIYLKLTCGTCKCSRHLVGKVVIITGANAGIGYETAKDLSARGARVILACRDESRGAAARDAIISESGNSDVHYRHLDLASLASVRAFAQQIIATEPKLHILINNAGVYEVDNVKTEDGLSLVMQSNHFGHFLLTSLLLPLLKSSAPSRIINVSSIVHRFGKVDLDNLNMEKETKSSYSISQAYSNSKLYNVLMTIELDRRLSGTGVTTYSLHPGVIFTGIWTGKYNIFERILIILYKPFSKTGWEGAQTTIFLAVSPDIEKLSSGYFSDCQLRNTNKIAQDDEVARNLWEASERLVKLK